MFLVFGIIGLWLGTKWIINGALGVAARFNLSHTFVGVAILAIGTDLPEVFVSINAAILHLNGIESSGIITGNAIGSSISQITFILGVAGLMLHFTMTGEDMWRDVIGLITSVLLLFIFGLDGIINRLEGGVLILVYVIYYIILLKNRKAKSEENTGEKNHSLFSLMLFLGIGFFVLILSSHLVVEHAMSLATQWGVAQSFVGIVIIGLGTSLPELAVSVASALRKSTGMTVGNIIGSNIFDGLIPIGLGGVISTTNMEHNLLLFDLPFLFVVTVLVIILLRSKRGISKMEGVVLVFIYFVYLGLKLFYFEGIILF